uniref:2-keto-3-deoxy-L-rhamnonate aldolase n=3 Tax=Noccaea caerulescens TaxID=107243 RepID=A0A1J3E3D8_NOCCA
MASDGSSISQPIHARKSLKSRLREGDKLYGLFLLSFSPDLAEIAALAGYDFIIVDLEHGAGGISDALNCIRAIEAGGCSAVLRVPDISQAWAKKALDLGPDGIMFPMVESGRSASEAVSFCRYRPDGVRGCAYSIVRDSKFGFDEAYLASYADKLLVMCQIESEEGVKNVNEIVAVDGMDCVMMGPRDLSASLGLLHDPGNPKVKSAMKTAETAVLASDPEKGGAYLAGMATAQDKAVDLRARGYHVVLGSADLSLFKKAAVDDVKGFKLL